MNKECPECKIEMDYSSTGDYYWDEDGEQVGADEVFVCQKCGKNWEFYIESKVSNKIRR